MKFTILALALIAGPAAAQQALTPRWTHAPDTRTDREVAIAVCFRDAPDGSRRDAWIDHCLKEAR
jgi:hypothetical protein